MKIYPGKKKGSVWILPYDVEDVRKAIWDFYKEMLRLNVEVSAIEVVGELPLVENVPVKIKEIPE